MAGSSSFEASERRVGDWFNPARLMWGYSDDLWNQFGVSYQPVSVLVTSDGYEVDRWFGALPEADIRAALDELIAYG